MAKSPGKKTDKQIAAEEAEAARIGGRVIRNLDVEAREQRMKDRRFTGVDTVYAAMQLRKPKRPLTVEVQQEFLEELEKCGVIRYAVIIAGTSEAAVGELRRKDVAFDEAVKMAINAYEAVLVGELQRRAVVGVTKPVIGGMYKDEVVAHVQEYSDGLMTTLVQSRVAEFKKSQDAADAGGGGGVLIVPNRCESFEEWEATYGPLSRGAGEGER